MKSFHTVREHILHSENTFYIQRTHSKTIMPRTVKMHWDSIHMAKETYSYDKRDLFI